MKIVHAIVLGTVLSAATLFTIQPRITHHSTFVSNKNSSISGTVTDAGSPIINVLVEIKGKQILQRTDAKGAFSFNALAAASYTLKFTAKGYVEKDTLIQLQENQSLEFTIQLEQEVIIDEQDVLSENKEIIISTPAESVYESKTLGYNTNAVSKREYSSGAVMQDSYSDYYNEDFNTEDYDFINENGFKKVIGNPLSTFSIDVDNASYSNIRRFISNNQAPPKDAVRIEEMINYFDYNYAHPTGEHPFEINTEISDCPWNPETKLIMIGLQGKDIDYSKADPSNLVFLIDVSGSMSQENKLPLVKTALNKLIENLDEKDRIAIVVYAGAAGLVLPSTPATQKQKINDALNALQSGGSTAGGAGIELAYKTAMENFIEGGNNRVILCTDGDFNIGSSGNADMVRLIEEKRKSGVFLTICGFGMGNYKDSKMEGIANNGNGNYYYIDNENEAKKVFVTDMRGTLFTIAKDVKIQVEFNPAKVAEYRLIGYENRLLNNEDFDNDAKDAGELGAGHRVTAMYEVKLKDNANFSPQGSKTDGEDLKYQTTQVNENAKYSNEIMTLKLRYKKPDGDVSKLVEKSITDTKIPFAQTSDNFRFASSVIEFGMLLRDSEYKGSATYESVVKLANGAKGSDKEGYRAEFIGMVQTFIGFAQVK
ncbi:MAG: von Willebrand factor type A domain-containing protein [Chitinophagales bacterium]|nr:von Willebrand factor type A domain-containing protein [Chitinophagales bacterium]MBP9189304.1 von Willebrand factor type A domain-containing protein [Chitinophagales bacterium]MBP9704217.1 von Willebrand factor type A domain-containing protein [Chitinophagales bacterium]